MKAPEGMIRETAAAKLLGYTVWTLKKWRVVGKGPAYYKGRGGAVFYKRADLAAFAKQRAFVRVEPEARLAEVRP